MEQRKFFSLIALALELYQRWVHTILLNTTVSGNINSCGIVVSFEQSVFKCSVSCHDSVQKIVTLKLTISIIGRILLKIKIVFMHFKVLPSCSAYEN